MILMMITTVDFDYDFNDDDFGDDCKDYWRPPMDNIVKIC